jgi:hypothetical protein
MIVKMLLKNHYKKIVWLLAVFAPLSNIGFQSYIGGYFFETITQTTFRYSLSISYLITILALILLLKNKPFVIKIIVVLAMFYLLVLVVISQGVPLCGDNSDIKLGKIFSQESQTVATTNKNSDSCI